MLLRLAVTGGPSGGKTSLLDTLSRELEADIALVPEAASILYKGGFPRFSESLAIQKTQTAIYHTQKQLEELIMARYPERLIICDRGSLDGAAYWPPDAPDFYKLLQSSEEHELRRYDWVLHLDTAPSKGYETSNVIRTENYDQALILNEKIHWAWRNHPQRLVIPPHQDFLKKLTICVRLVQGLLRGHTALEIQELHQRLLQSPSP